MCVYKSILAVFFVLSAAYLGASPYASAEYFDNTKGGNKILFELWNKKGLRYPTICSDAVFLRCVAPTSPVRPTSVTNTCL